MLEELTLIEKVIGFLLSLGALGALISRIVHWFRKRRQMKKDKDGRILKKLEELCTGQIMIEKRMIKMDEDRADARKQIASDRKTDTTVRSNQYLLNIAVLDAIFKLAEHEGLTINGEVAQCRKDNIGFLKNGTGIYHSCDVKEGTK